MLLEIQAQGKTLSVSEADKDGDVEIEITNSWGNSTYLYMSQAQIKELRDHLNKQLKA